MLKVDKYKTAQYREPLYDHGPTDYLVPEKITEHKLNTTTGQYELVGTYQGRNEAGKKLHEGRSVLKNYHQSLKDNKDPLYKEQIKCRNKEGFWDEENYSARRMLEDKKFNPANQVWTKRWHSRETWSDDSPIPVWKEPYWHTTHSISKSNDWIFAHIESMKKRLETGLLNEEEFSIILEELDKCIIQI